MYNKFHVICKWDSKFLENRCLFLKEKKYLSVQESIYARHVFLSEVAPSCTVQAFSYERFDNNTKLQMVEKF